MKMFLILLVLIICVVPVNAGGYTIDSNTVFINDSNVYLSATPHTLTSSGWVYFNLTAKSYTGNIDAAWGFNTSVSKPTKAELYKPHWVNITSDHEHIFYNVSWYDYDGNELHYGNEYNNNYSYTVKHEVTTYNETTMDPDGSEWIWTNIAFDSFLKIDDTTYIIYWHDRHDKYVLWKDYTNSFTSVNHDYEGYDTWYYVKNIPVASGQNYGMRAWVEVPVSLEKTSGKYYFAVKPSFETIPEAIISGHFYALDPWWDSSWDYYKTITINQTMVSQSIGDGIFPMYINITDSDLAAKAQADGDDIIFTDANNSTQLAHQISVWNITTGHLKAYVNVTDISNVSSINMYYGNAGATNTENPSGVWGANASGIWLMDEGTGLYANDSSGNDNIGTLENGVAWDSNGLNLDGVDDYVFNNGDDNSLDIVSGITLELRTILNSYSTLNKQTTFISRREDGQTTNYDLRQDGIDGKISLLYRNSADSAYHKWSTTSNVISLDVLHDIVFVHTFGTGSLTKLYVDGVEKSGSWILGNGNDAPITNNNIITIGGRADLDADSFINGTINNVKIYNRALSAEEIATRYNNTNSPELFISVGTEQSEVAGEEYTPPIPTNLHNTTGNFWVYHSWTAGSGNVTDSYNVSINGTWCNTTSNLYYNHTGLSPHDFSEIFVYAYNTTGNCTISTNYVTDNVIIPNNPIVISNISTSYSIDEGDVLYIDAEVADPDSDTPFFADNSTPWNVNSGTGVVSWQTVGGDNGTYHWLINVNDGYGSTDTQVFTVTVSVPSVYYNVSGYVFDINGSSVYGAAVSDDQSIDLVYTNISGYYLLSGYVNDSYTISASKNGYFTNSTVAVVSGDVSDINITLLQIDYTNKLIYEKLEKIESNMILLQLVCVLNFVVIIAVRRREQC